MHGGFRAHHQDILVMCMWRPLPPWSGENYKVCTVLKIFDEVMPLNARLEGKTNLGKTSFVPQIGWWKLKTEGPGLCYCLSALRFLFYEDTPSTYRDINHEPTSKHWYFDSPPAQYKCGDHLVIVSLSHSTGLPILLVSPYLSFTKRNANNSN